ncbi:MAG: hypothetical protein IV090_08280 [Candidatus Sericytochromatia bacterium]|nr:hypothetical protein [Candidatus Sericytochromatia bacterium]
MSQSEAPTFKAFEVSALEKQSLLLTQGLKGKALPAQLPAAEKKKLEELLLAFRNAQRAKLLTLCADFYQAVLDPNALTKAYFVLKNQALSGTPDYQIVMDSLTESYGTEVPTEKTGPEMPLEQALTQVLLAITRSDKNSISYTRTDAETGKPRPTTFPLSEKLIRNFVLPFGEQYLPLIQRVLVFSKGQVLGHPAGQLAHRYHLRKQAFEVEKAAWEKVQADNKAQLAEPRSPAQISQKLAAQQATRSVSQEISGLISGARNPDEKAAVVLSFQAQSLLNMLKNAQANEGDFGSRLEKLYSQRLSADKAQLLSKRLASQMKRMMLKMDGWKEEYWSEFQTLMQKSGLWEGGEWLEKWRAHKSGKEIIAKTGQEYLIEDKSDPLADMLKKQAQIADKQRGSKMLGQEDPVELPDWLTNANASQASAEEQKVLQALSRKDRFQEFAQVACPPGLWEALAAQEQNLLQERFLYFSHTDLLTIKNQILASNETPSEVFKQALAALELLVVKMATLLKREFKLNFVQALEQFQAQKQADLAKARFNSKEYQSSPAAQYGKYSG